MRILHLCISCFYIDKFSYQENIFPIINHQAGHEVKIIASTETYIENLKLGYVNSSSYFTPEGIPIVRIDYAKWLPKIVGRKIRVYRNLMKEMNSFKPDFIFFHGTAAVDLIKVAKYIEYNPNVRLVVDCHEAFYNSARNWISKNLLHRLIYRRAFLKALPYIDKVFYIGMGEKEYIDYLYGLPEDRMKLLPLGDIIISESSYQAHRKLKREELRIAGDDTLIIHSGKLSRKNCTQEIIESFLLSKRSNQKLLIIGIFEEDVFANLKTIIEDNSDSILYVGWKESDELKQYLCAGDIYVQFSVSATLMSALCRKCYGITTNPNNTYGYFPPDLCSFISTDTELVEEFRKIGDNADGLKQMRERSFTWASFYLNYETQMQEKVLKV